MDARTVKLYWRGELIKVHPVMAPGRRHTDAADLPAEVSVYAMRDLNTLQRKPSAHGIMSAPTPRRCWSIRCRGPRCVRSTGFGAGAPPGAGRREPAGALDTEVIDVGLIDRMCSRGTGEQLPLIPAPPAASRFVRATTDFAVRRPS